MAAFLGAAMLALISCGTTKPTAQAAAPKALTSLEDVCAALLPDADYQEIRAVFGAGVVADEGELYINSGTSRALEPIWDNDVNGALAGFRTLPAPPHETSAWTVRGLKIGDSMEAVERVNGRPFDVLDNGVDWRGGALAGGPCTYAMVFGLGEAAPPEIRLAAEGKISGFSMRWRRDVPYTVPKPALAAPVPVETRRSFKEICDKLHEDMSLDDLRRAFGTQNMREVRDSDGAPSAIVFPDDPQRAFRVRFHGDAGGEVGPFYSVEIESPTSTWALPNGLGMGDRIEAVERAAGGPFDVGRWNNRTAGGPMWDHKAAGSLGACSYHVTLEHDRALIDRARFRSDDPAFRSWRPRVSAFRVDWRWF
jgi:hypothetical protein